MPVSRPGTRTRTPRPSSASCASTRPGPDRQLVGEFVDRASADDLRRRREWRRLLELAQARKVDLIVLWRLDRAFRSVLDGAATLAQLRAGGCGIRSLQEPWIDTTTPMREAMFHITAAWAHLEKQVLIERTRTGMERARAEGKLSGRPLRRPVEQHPRFVQVRDLVVASVLTRAEGARRLRVRYSAFVAALRKGGGGEGVDEELVDAS